jgi:hypothetical protein
LPIEPQNGKKIFGFEVCRIETIGDRMVVFRLDAARPFPLHPWFNRPNDDFSENGGEFDMAIWPQVLGFLLIGYLGFGRSFAYLGVAPLYIGELTLAAFLVLKPRVVLSTWITSLLRPSPLNALALALFVFMVYGVWQVARGLSNGSGLIYTLKFFVFNYYALYLFLGIWVALQAPDLLPKLIRILAWVNGIYGILFVVFLRHVDIHLQGSGGTGVPLFSAPIGQAVVVLGLLCFERNLRAVWLVLVLNVLVSLAWQVRSEWFGLGLGAIAWGFLTGRLGRVLAIGMAGVVVLGIIELAGIELIGRSGDQISLSENLARVIAPINLELAKQLSPNAVYHAGTAEWRELWWDQIWLSVHSTPMLEAFGHGYGFDLFGLAPAEVRAGQEDWEVRTPHSIFFYALGYTGWVGVVLFALLHLAILRLLWRAFALTGQPVGIVWWILGMGRAFFEEGFETPFKAIPFYLLMGLCIAPALQWMSGSDAVSRQRTPLPPKKQLF